MNVATRNFPGSARGSRAGDRGLAIANFFILTYFGEAAEMCTRAACAPRNKRARRPHSDGYS